MSTWMDECGNQHHTCDDDCAERCNHCGAFACNLDDEVFSRWRTLKGEDPLCPKCQLKFPTVLVVDDDELLLDTLVDGLNAEGMDAHGASTMAAVVEHLSKHAYGVVLLDLQGGDIDRAKVGEVARAKGARVVTMSGAPELGPNLAKPFRLEALYAQVRAAVSG